jgi:hypothetical protein
LIGKDVKDAREMLNFSAITDEDEFEPVAKRIKNGAIPPKKYLALHAEANLTGGGKDSVSDRFEKELRAFRTLMFVVLHHRTLPDPREEYRDPLRPSPLISFKKHRPAVDATGRLLFVLPEYVKFPAIQQGLEFAARSNMLEPNMIGLAGTCTVVGRAHVSRSFVAELADGSCP